MIIDELLRARNMSRYRLSKLSCVPQATLSDICSGKALLENCKAGTVYRIAGALGTTVETLLETDRERPVLQDESVKDEARARRDHSRAE